MIEHDDICHAARRFSDYVSLHPENPKLLDLFGSVGLDEDLLAHMLQHALELGVNIEPASFGMGVLLALMSADETEISLTDHDIKELLNPLP